MTLILGRAKILRTEVNKQAMADDKAFFEICNDSYEKRIRDIAHRIACDDNRVKLIMLSGPSASGKTTTSLKIMEELGKLGVEAVTISMDDFFKCRDETPKLEDGSRDFESIKALDHELLKSTLSCLIEKGEASLPIYNFKLGRRGDDMRKVELKNSSVALVEGLHALDTVVTDGISADRILKIYVSVSSDFVNEDATAVLTAREVRLIRRTVRDHNFRGSSPENTLDMWDSVCRGEDRYVRPFKKYADITVNSLYKCEPCIFKDTAISLFKTVNSGSIHYERAQHIISALSGFEPMQLEIVPSSCMLREFFGGSIYFNKSAKKA